MPGIAFDSLTKHYGEVTALDGLTFHVTPGRITAFLGANGSGKTTSMRLLLGLSEPDAGLATIDGERYVDLAHPTRRVGAVLDQGFHPNRSARNHLRIVAAQAAMPGERVNEVLDLVELTPPPSAGSAASRWACVSVWLWPRRSSVTRRSSSSTNRSTAWTPLGSRP